MSVRLRDRGDLLDRVLGLFEEDGALHRRGTGAEEPPLLVGVARGGREGLDAERHPLGPGGRADPRLRVPRLVLNHG